MILKSHTTVEQSTKLAEFLTKDTADMYFEPSPGFCTEPSEVRVGDIKYAHPRSIPCWSLAALLSLLKRKLVSSHGEVYCFHCEPFVCDGEPLWLLRYDEIYDEAEPIEADANTELLDACYEMILKLHDQNLL